MMPFFFNSFTLMSNVKIKDYWDSFDGKKKGVKPEINQEFDQEIHDAYMNEYIIK